MLVHLKTSECTLNGRPADAPPEIEESPRCTPIGLLPVPDIGHGVIRFRRHTSSQRHPPSVSVHALDPAGVPTDRLLIWMRAKIWNTPNPFMSRQMTLTRGIAGHERCEQS